MDRKTYKIHIKHLRNQMKTSYHLKNNKEEETGKQKKIVISPDRQRQIKS